MRVRVATQWRRVGASGCELPADVHLSMKLSDDAGLEDDVPTACGLRGRPIDGSVASGDWTCSMCSLVARLQL
jgi:hypothetical protein